MTPLARPLALALLALSPQAPEGGPPPQIALPPSAAARALAALGPDTRPVAPDLKPWPAWEERGESGWGGELAWRRWVELVRAEARAETPDPRRRAALALLARAQGRDLDAWAHFAACAGAPETLAWLAPALALGADPFVEGTARGVLADGVVLTPALPPGEAPLAPVRETSVEGITIGGARAKLTLRLEPDGVQVDLAHQGGGAAELGLRMRAPQGFAIGVLYADWERQDGAPTELRFTLSAEAPEHTVWGRFERQRRTWPAGLPERGWATLGGAGIAVIAPDPQPAILVRLAEALGELFEVPSEAVPSRSIERDGALAPVELTIPAGPAGEAELSGILSLAERFALERGG